MVLLVFLVMAVVLVIKPYGLMGKRPVGSAHAHGPVEPLLAELQAGGHLVVEVGEGAPLPVGRMFRPWYRPGRKTGHLFLGRGRPLHPALRVEPLLPPPVEVGGRGGDGRERFAVGRLRFAQVETRRKGEGFKAEPRVVNRVIAHS